MSSQQPASHVLPKIPLILRGKKRRCQTSRNQPIQGGAIRRNLDVHLGSIITVLRNQRSKNPRVTKQLNNAIPHLDNQLVRQYLELVYQDYGIRDPLADVTEIECNMIAPHLTSRTNRSITQNNIQNSHRRAVNLKQSFLIEMFSESNRSENSSPDHHHNKEVQNQRNVSTYANSERINRNMGHGSLKNSGDGYDSLENRQVKSVYRYCFICEQPILETNIKIHEKLRCPQFSTLYHMSASELRQIILTKISRMHNEVSQRQNAIKHSDRSFTGLFKQTEQYLTIISSSIFDKTHKTTNTLQTRKNLRSHFNRVFNEFETDYFILYELVRKLQWFVSIYINLQNTLKRYETQLNDSGHFQERTTIDHQSTPVEEQNQIDTKLSLHKP